MKRLLTLRGVAKFLGVSETTVARMAENDELAGAAVRIHKRTLYQADALEKWLEAGGTRTQASGDAPRTAA